MLTLKMPVPTADEEESEVERRDAAGPGDGQADVAEGHEEGAGPDRPDLPDDCRPASRRVGARSSRGPGRARRCRPCGRRTSRGPCPCRGRGWP